MHYQWQQQGSLLKHVEFVALHKEEEAIIYTPQDASRQQLQHIPDALRDQGMVTTPDVVNGEYVLRVQHYGGRERLLRTLEESGFTQGKPEHHPSDSEIHTEKPEGLMERVKKDSVRASGVVYLLGDALLAAAGVLRGDMAEAATGVIWGSTGAVLTVYGKKNPDVQDKILYKKLGDFFKQEGVNLSVEGNDQSLKQLAGDQGITTKMQTFLYDHPVEFNNTLQGVGGVMMAKAGYANQRDHNGTPNYFKTAAGISVAAGQWGGMILDPKPREKDAPAPTVGSVDWFEEKPLRLTGVLAFSNNVLNLAGAYFHDKPHNQHIDTVDRKEFGELLNKANAHKMGYEDTQRFQELRAKMDSFDGVKERDAHGKPTKHGLAEKNAVWFNTGAAACYMLANALYGMSDKDTSVSLKDIGKLDEVYGVAAHVIGAQKPEVQAGMVERVAGYLSTQPDVNQSAEDIAKQLKLKISQMDKNPWASSIPEKSVQYPIYQQRAVDAPQAGSSLTH